MTVLDSVRTTLAQFAWWTAIQWWIAAGTAAVMFLTIGEVGQTLPPASAGRVYPIEWWNYVTLVADSGLIGMVVGSLVMPIGRRAAAASGGGLAGTLAAIVMACPVCSPLAIPLLGAGGVLSFMRGDRGWLALASVLVLGLTLILRLRATRSCAVPRSAPSQISVHTVR